MSFWEYVDTLKGYASEISVAESILTVIISIGVILSFITKTGRTFLTKIFLGKHPKEAESGGQKDTPIASSISALLVKLQDKNMPLSTCLSEALVIAFKINNSDFVEFCNNELTGWSDKKARAYSPDRLRYREIEVYTSLGKVNMSYSGFRTANDIFDVMENDSENFIKANMVSPETVSTIEDYIARCDERLGIISISVPSTKVMPEKGADGVNIYYYSSLNSYRRLLFSIKAELIRQLIEIRKTI